MNYEALVKSVRLCSYALVIAAVSYAVGRSSTTGEKVDITTTAEFTQAVDAKVAEIRTQMETEYSKKTKKTVIRKPDGTVQETTQTSDSGKKTETKVETKIEYREKVVEKVVEKIVYVDSKPQYSTGLFFEPLPALKYDWKVGVSFDYRLVGGLFLTSTFGSAITRFEPRVTLGVRIEF
jgi:hypothetical protein